MTVPVSGFVTTIALVPVVLAGVSQVMDVEETTVMFAHGNPSTVTVRPETKPVPVIVIVVPPTVAAAEGETPEIVGNSK